MVTAKWWSERRLGLVSLAVSLLEVLIIYGGLLLIVGMKLQHAPPRLWQLASSAYLFGTFFSFSFAIAGLLADARKIASSVALILAMGTFLVCGLQMLA